MFGKVQIEMDIKQIMVLKPNNLFEKCLFKTNHTQLSTNTSTPTEEVTYSNDVSNFESPVKETPLDNIVNETSNNVNQDDEINETVNDTVNTISDKVDTTNVLNEEKIINVERRII